MHLAATAMVAVAATPTMMPTTGVGAEHEAAEEDDGNDEHDTGHDPDPRGNRIEPAVSAQVPALAPVLVRRRRRRRRLGGWRGRRWRGGDGAGTGFGGRRWFGHVLDDRLGIQVSPMNSL
jgi:hypothetical protein